MHQLLTMNGLCPANAHWHNFKNEKRTNEEGSLIFKRTSSSPPPKDTYLLYLLVAPTLPCFDLWLVLFFTMAWKNAFSRNHTWSLEVWSPSGLAICSHVQYSLWVLGSGRTCTSHQAARRRIHTLWHCVCQWCMDARSYTRSQYFIYRTNCVLWVSLRWVRPSCNVW